MANGRGIISEAYEGFFLRDVLSFIIPGSIVIIGLSLIIGIPLNFVKSLQEWLTLNIPVCISILILIFGIIYVIGFAIQSIGINFLKIIKFYKANSIKLFDDKKKSNNNSFSIFSRNTCLLKRYRYYQITFYNMQQEFFESATDKEKNISERCTILKQMTGNTAVSILIILITYRIKNFSYLRWNPLDIFTILLSLAIIILLIEHHHQINRQFDWRMAVLSRKGKI